MEINFISDPGQAPKPRSEIRIEALEVTPYEDHRRARVELTITPFSPADRPNIQVTAYDAAGREVSQITVIETLDKHFSITLHLRGAQLADGFYRFQANLFYEDAAALQSSVERVIELQPKAQQDQEGH